MTNTIENPRKDHYKSRLQARKDRLEREALQSRMRLENNAHYAAQNAPAMIGATVSKALHRKSPALSRLLGRFGVGQSPARKQVSPPLYAQDYDATGVPYQTVSSNKSWVSLVENIALPLLLTLGQRKMFAMGLRGSGKIVGSALKSSLGRIFRRRRR